MKFPIKTIVFFFALCFNEFVNPARIIALTPFASQSHKNVFVPLVEELASRGHEVILISPSISSKPLRNVTEFAIAGNRELFSSFQNNIFNHSIAGGTWKYLGQLKKALQNADKNVVTDQYIQTLVSEGLTFDLAIVNAYMNGICYLVAPLIAKNIILLSPHTYSALGSLSPALSPSTLPSPMFSFPEKMNFFQRTANALLNLGFKFFFADLFFSGTEELARKYIPKVPSLEEAKQQISLLLNNADPVLTFAKSQVSTSIDVGGMHCKPAEKLPQHFEDFIEDDHGEGVILFSLGSIFPAKTMPISIIQEFLSAFSQLKQKIIWKFEEAIEDLPPNIMISSWVPQQDLLGHPKVRLFITHGGLLSLQETIYHGVPVIGIPLFADQPGNVVRIMELGLGKQLDLIGIKAKKIVKTINDVLTDESYSKTMERYSAIMKEQMEPPVQRAVFWVEYVIRHGGATHFRDASSDLHTLQYHHLDIIGGIIVVLSCLIGSCFYISLKCLKYLIKRN